MENKEIIKILNDIYGELEAQEEGFDNGDYYVAMYNVADIFDEYINKFKKGNEGN